MRAEIPPQAELRVPPQTETQDRLRLHRPIRLGGTSRLQRKRLSGSSRWGSRSHPGLKGSLLVTTSQLSKDQKTQSFFGLGGKSFYLYAII